MIPRPIFEHSLLGFFAPVRKYLEEEGLTEVLVNGPGNVYIERKGRLYRANVRFAGYEDLMSGLRNLAQYVGRPFDPLHPILEAHLPDGSRVEAVMPPAAPDGPYVCIRRFFREKLTAERLIAMGAVTPEAMDLLRALVALKQNIIVAGGTSSGKTSLLNVLSAYVSPDERIVVIEDSRELQLQQPHVVRMEAQPGDAKGKGKITIRDLFRASLRMRPDRIVVGEVRGPESLDLIQAMTSGHGGCLSTVHATHPQDTTARLETLALMSDVGLPLPALRPQLASAIDFIVHTSRLRTGDRCITSISEVLGYDHDRGYLIDDLYLRHYDRDPTSGTMRTRLTATGKVPRCQEQILAYRQEQAQERRSEPD
jgi:pilus assembly protein CpaF